MIQCLIFTDEAEAERVNERMQKACSQSSAKYIASKYSMIFRKGEQIAIKVGSTSEISAIAKTALTKEEINNIVNLDLSEWTL